MSPHFIVFLLLRFRWFLLVVSVGVFYFNPESFHNAVQMLINLVGWMLKTATDIYVSVKAG